MVVLVAEEEAAAVAAVLLDLVLVVHLVKVVDKRVLVVTKKDMVVEEVFLLSRLIGLTVDHYLKEILLLVMDMLRSLQWKIEDVGHLAQVVVD
tara:strand:- start:5 stop:283 length:279 start_codon:yes stop_codon:yes gene_type:complete